MPKFVKACRSDFTTFHNAMWRDKNLGLTERGLLGTMITLPDEWDFSTKGLSTLFPDGEHKVGTALKKLEKAGYLKREQIRENGRIVDWKYTYSDEPIFLRENNISSDTDGTDSEPAKLKQFPQAMWKTMWKTMWKNHIAKTAIWLICQKFRHHIAVFQMWKIKILKTAMLIKYIIIK